MTPSLAPSAVPAPLLRAAAAHLDRLWPLPALLGWAGAWALFAGLRDAAAPAWIAVGGGTAVGLLLALTAPTRMRAALVAAGFPVALLASGAVASLPAWAWLLPLAGLLCVYPLHAWRDAPYFPTPPGALDGLAAQVPLPPDATVLDAGCGLGAGLAALRRAYPHARLEGVEWSWPLALAARWRCRFGAVRATVRRGDMWAGDWRGCALVYLFQRPESLPRAVAKARDELHDGAWLASLEFEALELRPQAVLRGADGRPVWLYRAPFAAAGARPAGSRRDRGPSQVSTRGADKSG